MEPTSSSRSNARSSSRTPRSAPSCPGAGRGLTKYRSLTTTPIRLNAIDHNTRTVSHVGGRHARAALPKLGDRAGVAHPQGLLVVHDAGRGAGVDRSAEPDLEQLEIGAGEDLLT